MQTLKFKVFTDKGLEDDELEMDFAGTPEEKVIASSLITKLCTTPSIVGMDYADIEKLLGKKTNKLLIYEFSLTFEPNRLAEKIKGAKYMVYAIEGSHDLLHMNLIQLVGGTISDNTEISVGAPYDTEKTRTIKITALYN